MDLPLLLSEILALGLMISIALTPTALGYLWRKEH